MLSVSTARSFISVLASVSRRCTARSASASGMRAASRFLRAAPCAASAASAACSAVADRGLRAFDRGGHRREVGPALGDGGEAGFDVGDFAFHARDALGLLARGRGELVAPRGEVGERAGQFAEGFFRGADDAVGLGRAGIDAGAAFGAGPHFVAQRLFFLGELGQRGFGVGDQRAFARDVLLELREPAVELGQTLAGTGLLGVERVAGDEQALQRRGGARLGVAERRHAFGGRLAALAGLGLRDRRVGDGANAQVLGAARCPRPRHWRRASAGNRAWPRPCGPRPRRCDSGSPAGPGASARRSGRPVA